MDGTLITIDDIETLPCGDALVHIYKHPSVIDEKAQTQFCKAFTQTQDYAYGILDYGRGGVFTWDNDMSKNIWRK